MNCSRNLCKQIFCVLLVLSAMVGLSVTAAANVWTAPTDKDYKEDVYHILDEEDGRRTINLFLSNFSEANLLAYDATTATDGEVLKTLFKHFELNALNYSGVTVGSDGGSGKVMVITQNTIEKAAKNMFGLAFTKHPVADFKGYEDGSYVVTANAAGSPLKVLSIAKYVEYRGENVYEAYFTIYKTEANIENYYSYEPMLANETPALKAIGEGVAKFTYVGGDGITAFRLTGYNLTQINKAELVYTNPNEPSVLSAIPTTEATFTEQAQNDATTNTVDTQTTISDKAVINEVKDKADLDRLIYVTVFVVVAAVAATVIIVAVYRKKKEKTAE